MTDTARFQTRPTPLPGVVELNRKPIRDHRGSFSRFYCQEEFAELGLPAPVQINHSASAHRGTIRGLHFQYAPSAETKIVTCMQGRIFDVALDLRAGSPTFLQWHGVTLSADEQNSLVVPPGVAHGFQTLTDDAHLLYLVSAMYSAGDEDGINPLDPAAAIAWPLPPGDMSPRDQQRAFLRPGQFPGLGPAGERNAGRRPS